MGPYTLRSFLAGYTSYRQFGMGKSAGVWTKLVVLKNVRVLKPERGKADKLDFWRSLRDHLRTVQLAPCGDSQ
jgi:hypothetical protein